MENKKKRKTQEFTTLLFFNAQLFDSLFVVGFIQGCPKLCGNSMKYYLDSYSFYNIESIQKKISED